LKTWKKNNSLFTTELLVQAAKCWFTSTNLGIKGELKQLELYLKDEVYE